MATRKRLVEPGPLESLQSLHELIGHVLKRPTPYLMADTQFRQDGTRIQSIHLENFVVVRYYGKADLVPAEP